MSDHHGPPASKSSAKSSSKKGDASVEGFVMGMHELMHKSGVGAMHEVHKTIGDFFAKEGGTKHH